MSDTIDDIEEDLTLNTEFFMCEKYSNPPGVAKQDLLRFAAIYPDNCKVKIIYRKAASAAESLYVNVIGQDPSNPYHLKVIEGGEEKILDTRRIECVEVVVNR